MQNLTSYNTSNHELFPEMMSQFMLENSGTIDSRRISEANLQKIYYKKETKSDIYAKNDFVSRFLFRKPIATDSDELANIHYYQNKYAEVRDNSETLLNDNAIVEKLEKLQKDIGNRLFEKLNWNQRMFMAKTAGIIEFENKIDINSVYEYLESYES